MADFLFGGVPLMPVPGRKVRKFRFRAEFSSLTDFADEEIRSRYRFGRESIEYLEELLREDLERQTARNHALSNTVQILAALRFYAPGSFLQVIGDTLGLLKSAVSRIVTNVSNALTRKQKDFIKWPATEEEIGRTKRGFYDKGGFPGVIGCVDGTHIRIQAPHENENDYVNRKGFHSINVQAICDHQGMFTNVVARWPGSAHDSFIFNDSAIGQWFQTQPRTIEDGLLLGDSGYACRPYLMTPYPNPSNVHQERFNSAHRKTRVEVEQTFGWWKRRFHVLHSEIRMAPEKACTVVGACAVLHNIASILREPMDDYFDDDNNDDYDDDDNDQPDLEQYRGPEDGRVARDHIYDSFFKKKYLIQTIHVHSTPQVTLL